MLTFAATVAVLGLCPGCQRAGAHSDGGAKLAPPPPPITVSRTAAVPEPLRAAAETLFAQGLADPLGGEYREITVRVGSVWGGESDVKTHGWVLPERAGAAGREAVCANGLIYKVRSVGKSVRVRDDVAKYLRSREAARKKYGTTAATGWRDATPESESASVESLSPLYLCLLLRLGENEPAASLYREWEASLLARIDTNRANLPAPYFLLANRWAWALYDRAVCAHMRGDDALAATDAALLTRAQPLVEAEIARRGAQTHSGGEIKVPESPALPFLSNLPELREEANQRVEKRDKAPLDLVALKKIPQGERVTTLIAHLDDVAARQDGQPGGVGLDDSPISEALIAEGEAAIEPLLDVLEKDERLTRSVSFGRDFFQSRTLLSVRSAAFACFVRITGVSEFRDGRDVKALRAWWALNKGLTSPERWFAQLADEGTPLTVAGDDPERSSKELTHRVGNVSRWIEAADRILRRNDVTERGNWLALPARDETKPLPPFQGEPLRTRTNPSVSQLFEKRALSYSGPAGGDREYDNHRGAVFALRLYVWDPRNQRTLPTLQTMMRRCVAFENNQPKGEGHSEQGQTGARIARLAIARVALGDAEAADEYATWLRTVNPTYLGYETRSSLYALFHNLENPVWERTATSLFGTDSSVWGRLFADPRDRGNYGATELLRGPMLRVAAFREHVQRRLGDRTVAGTGVLYRDAPASVSYRWLDGMSMGPTPTRWEKPQNVSMRICDRVALGLQELPGVPVWEPFAPEKERDRQCAAIAGYLRQYGPGFRESDRYERPLYGFDIGPMFDAIMLGFGTGRTPATERDVAANKAVFVLRAENRPRVVPDLSLPLEASWEKDPFAQVSKTPDGKTHRYSRGKIYQAEEEWDGKRWRRYYGFVGTHTIAKVPADEITITDFRYAANNAGTPAPKREP